MQSSDSTELDIVRDRRRRRPDRRARPDQPVDRAGRTAAETTSRRRRADATKTPSCPIEPASFRAAGLTDSEVEALSLKFLLARGDAAGREIADQIKLPFVLVDELLREMKNSQLVGPSRIGPDERLPVPADRPGPGAGRRYSQHCTYFGSAPVSLNDYVASVHAQSLTVPASHGRGPAPRLRGPAARASSMLDRLGPAINSGRGLFLFGPPGNGKSSIAERITAAFGREIWIPRAIGVDGEIIRLFDPVNHEEVAAGTRAPACSISGKYRQALDPHPPAHDRRRRRADHVATRRDHRTRRPASARRRCN